MKKKFTFVIVVTIILLALSHAHKALGQSSPNAATAPGQPHPAVARIRSLESNATSFGSGTLIYRQGKQGILITNYHVVKDAQDDILVTFPSGFRSSAKVVATDPRWDLAALLIWAPEIQPVVITDHPAKPGDTLTIAGYGSGRYQASSGICSQYVSPGMNQPREMVELRTVARQGDSGGPIFNQNGELAGVLFGAGWRTTAGSYSGRVKKFLVPVVARMQQVAAPLANAAPTVFPPNQNSIAPVSKPQAKITGLNFESESDGDVGADNSDPTPALDSLQLQPIEITSESEENGQIEVLIEDEFANAALMDENFLSQSVSVALEVAEQAGGKSVESEDAQIEEPVADMLDRDIAVETVEEPTVAPVDTEANLDESSGQPEEESTEPVLNETVSTRETLPPGQTTDTTATGEDATDVSADTDQLIGWEQLAGDTLLKQIRTILAGVGFLVIVVQLARRRQ
ncbi:MAG TPA: trypsin-like serine protease [Planctomycetes bacterium]|nr:trypsin-like serine protease [Planctomycetaceae bacterium]HIN54145.1 trypsin-like serine protease [Planctomycetota bacterium]